MSTLLCIVLSAATYACIRRSKSPRNRPGMSDSAPAYYGFAGLLSFMGAFTAFVLMTHQDQLLFGVGLSFFVLAHYVQMHPAVVDEPSVSANQGKAKLKHDKTRLSSDELLICLYSFIGFICIMAAALPTVF